MSPRTSQFNSERDRTTIPIDEDHTAYGVNVEDMPIACLAFVNLVSKQSYVWIIDHCFNAKFQPIVAHRQAIVVDEEIGVGCR